MTWEEFRKFARDVMGMPLSEDVEILASQPPVPPAAPAGGENPFGSQPALANNDPNSPLTQTGNPKMQPLNTIRART
jgi:hypothetical protein